MDAATPADAVGSASVPWLRCRGAPSSRSDQGNEGSEGTEGNEGNDGSFARRGAVGRGWGIGNTGRYGLTSTRVTWSWIDPGMRQIRVLGPYVSHGTACS